MVALGGRGGGASSEDGAGGFVRPHARTYGRLLRLTECEEGVGVLCAGRRGALRLLSMEGSYVVMEVLH